MHQSLVTKPSIKSIVLGVNKVEGQQNSNQRPNLLGAAQVQRDGLVGTIRHILYDRGFMFIEGEDGYDYFAHWTAVNRKCKQFRNLLEGEKVTFDIEEDAKNRGYRVKPNTVMIAA